MLSTLLTPSIFISYIFVLAIAFTVHEFAHAWTANRFGDDTPRLNGRLTLNPVAHLDPIGSLMLFVAGFGWAKPVPVNPYVLQRHSSAATMWVSLAGPASNFLMAVLASIPFQLGLVTAQDAITSMVTAKEHFFPTISQLLYIFISTNLLLMVFNLIPIAPLDGEKILYYFLPFEGQQFMDTIRPYGPILLLALIFVLPFLFRPLGVDILSLIIRTPVDALTRLLIL